LSQQAVVIFDDMIKLELGTTFDFQKGVLSQQRYNRDNTSSRGTALQYLNGRGSTTCTLPGAGAHYAGLLAGAAVDIVYTHECHHQCTLVAGHARAIVVLR